jgi:hypothetical protein
VIPFHGAALVSVEDESGVWVSLNHACEHIGISSQRQVRKLRAKPWARLRDDVPAKEMGQRGVNPVLIHLDSLPMWMATIEPSRVNEGAREMLEAYQIESANALRDYWLKGGAINPRAQEKETRRIAERLAGIEVRKSFTDHLKEVYERSETSASLSQWCINFTKMMTKKALMIDEIQFQERKATAGGNFRNSCSEAELRRIKGAELYVSGLVAMTEYGQIKTLYYDADEHMGLLAKIDRKQITA